MGEAREKHSLKDSSADLFIHCNSFRQCRSYFIIKKDLLIKI